MHSRVWIGILLIGVLGIVMLGLLTKFAIDANPGLRDNIRFKVAFARDFSSEGIGEISLRRRGKGGGYRLVMERSRTEATGNSSVLDQKIATYFAENFPDKSVRTLELSYVSGGSLGCAQGTPYHEQEIALSPVRVRLAARESRERLCRALEDDFQCRLVSEKREGRTLIVDLDGPALPEDSLRKLAEKMEPSIRHHFRINPYAKLRLRIWPRSDQVPSEQGASQEASKSPPKSVEVPFDPRGRPLES